MTGEEIKHLKEAVEVYFTVLFLSKLMSLRKPTKTARTGDDLARISSTKYKHTTLLLYQFGSKWYPFAHVCLIFRA
jgi:hypothetical protein